MTNRRHALITGGTSGIGLATALALVADGHEVAVCSRSGQLVTEGLSDEERKLADALWVSACDVTRPEALDRLMGEVEGRFGGLDAVFANAGVARFERTRQVSEASIDQTLGINVKGAFLTVQRALPLLRDGASVLFCSSAVAGLGAPHAAMYAASKAAVEALTRCLAVDLAPRVRVNCLSPGPTATPIQTKIDLDEDGVAEQMGVIQGRLRAGRMAEAGELAEMARFLLSSRSRFIYGSTVVVDGGLSI